MWRKPLAKPLLRKEPMAEQTISNGTTPLSDMLAGNCPKSQRMPSLLSRDRMASSGQAAVMSHDSKNKKSRSTHIVVAAAANARSRILVREGPSPFSESILIGGQIV